MSNVCVECQVCYECEACVTCQGQCETCQVCYSCERGVAPQQQQQQQQQPRQTFRLTQPTQQPMPQPVPQPTLQPQPMFGRPMGMPQDPLLMKLNEVSAKLDTLIDSISALIKTLQLKVERAGEIDREKLKPSK